jgi:uncharacterized SAM-binding protein YcdF (DUF218 family)
MSSVPGKKSGWERWARRAYLPFAALGFLMVIVTFTPLDYWWATALAGPWNDPRGDILIVLAGSMGGEGIIGESSYLRAEYALLAYKPGGFHAIVISGGGKPVAVAIAMRNFLIGEGVPPSAILTEDASMSTRQSAILTTQLVKDRPGKKVLLTSDYHMFRAHRVFRKAGLDVLPLPIPDARKRASNWKGRWPVFLTLTEETTKIVYYFLRGWL